MTVFRTAASEFDSLNPLTFRGEVVAARGAIAEVRGFGKSVSVGDPVVAEAKGGRPLTGEVIGFRDGRSLVMFHGKMEGIGMGSPVRTSGEMAVKPCLAWLGRIVDAFGNPLDGKGPMILGEVERHLKSPPPHAFDRKRMGMRLDTGIKVFNTFLPICRGQRMGIFAGSGVGKSTLMGMLTKYVEADVVVVGLIGERGREVKEFVQEILGEEGMSKAVVVVSTSDQAALLRRQAAYMTMTLAEHFRDEGLQVLALIDSVTRFAAAQREIGLASGEPPTMKAYPPTVFSELSALLERAGPGAEGKGDVTGVFTVLVDGGDHDEPVADAVRGILDGHVVLERNIAERGRYPAVNILKSVSRSLPGCHSVQENALLFEARKHMATYEDMAELVRIGAYKKGVTPAVDEAVRLREPLEEFLSQSVSGRTAIKESFSGLTSVLGQR